MNEKIKRANRIMSIAKDMAKGHIQLLNRLEEIQLHYNGYAEPGCVDAIGVVAVGNWHNVKLIDPNTNLQSKLGQLPGRIGDMFDKMGIEVEWYDEWTACSCGKLCRTSPDCHDWTPAIFMGQDECWCIDCVKNNEESYLCEFENNPDVQNEFRKVNPSMFGYELVNEEMFDNEETTQIGYFPGQYDSKQKIAGEMAGRGIERFLFSTDLKNSWDLYVHSSEVHLLNDEDEDEIEDDEHTKDCDCDSCCMADSNPEECDKGCDDDCGSCKKVHSSAPTMELRSRGEALIVNVNDCACKVCKASLNKGETPCWKCGTDNPTSA